MTTRLFPTAPAFESDLSRRLPAALAAILLGAFIAGSVAFAPMAAVHNAAHDVRHAIAVPCH